MDEHNKQFQAVAPSTQMITGEAFQAENNTRIYWLGNAGAPFLLKYLKY